MNRFTCIRKGEDNPHLEGVVFEDGTAAVHWVHSRTLQCRAGTGDLTATEDACWRALVALTEDEQATALALAQGYYRVGVTT